MEKVNLQYSVPISILENLESTENEENERKEFIIQGVAINATTTDNNHTFLPEELRKSVNTLLNRPLLKDHNEYHEKNELLSRFVRKARKKLKAKYGLPYADCFAAALGRCAHKGRRTLKMSGCGLCLMSVGQIEM